MIKCEVSVCGTIVKEASLRTNKEGKPFIAFTMSIVLPTKDGSKSIELSVVQDNATEANVSKFPTGTRLSVSGTLLLKKRSDNLYFNLYGDKFDFDGIATIDSIKGKMFFRGKLEKTIDERTDKKGRKYHIFSGVSSEKIEETFEHQWVNFFYFKEQIEECLKPETKVEIHGDLEISFFNERLNISSKVESASPYKSTYNANGM